MIRVGSIVIRVDDLAKQTAFWTAALDYKPRDENSDDFVLLRPKHGGGPNISLDRARRTPTTSSSRIRKAIASASSTPRGERSTEN
jgi:hypothetical protein